MKAADFFEWEYKTKALCKGKFRRRGHYGWYDSMAHVFWVRCWAADENGVVIQATFSVAREGVNPKEWRKLVAMMLLKVRAQLRFDLSNWT